MKKKLLEECYKTSLEYNTHEKHPQYECYKHYTFVIQNNQIVEWSTNRAGPPPYGYMLYQKMHSEFNAWMKAKGIIDRKKPFEIINIRLNKKGDLKISKPCRCCIAFLNQLKCRAIYFSIETGFSKIVF